MIIRLLKMSFYNQRKAMSLMFISVATGTALAASLITVSLEIGGKVAKELRAYGANIIVEPSIEGISGIAGQVRYLSEDDIPKIKTIFWRHNIIGIAPFLETKLKTKSGIINIIGAWFEKGLPIPGESSVFLAGVRKVSPWWYIDGEWPSDSKSGSILIGNTLSEQLGIKRGDNINLRGKDFRISGVLSTGGAEDEKIIGTLADVQGLAGLGGKVSTVLVSALTTPMEPFAYKDPNTMSKAEYEKWYCTGYVTSIAKQVEEVFKGGRARPIWPVAEAEGKVLDRLKFAIWLLSIFTLIASALGVSTTMLSAILRRREEIALMKAVGADRMKIGMLFLAEALLIGTAGGLSGYIISIEATHLIGLKVFGTAFALKAELLFIALLSAIIISILGSLVPLRKIYEIKPAFILRGG